MSAQSLQQTTFFNLEMENMTEADDAVDGKNRKRVELQNRDTERLKCHK